MGVKPGKAGTVDVETVDSGTVWTEVLVCKDVCVKSSVELIVMVVLTVFVGVASVVVVVDSTVDVTEVVDGLGVEVILLVFRTVVVDFTTFLLVVVLRATKVRRGP